jgi:hypothetical protein
VFTQSTSTDPEEITDLATGTTATVAATAAATGGTPTTFLITPTPTTSPATFTGTSPVTVEGLTEGTSYTFTAKGVNSTATGPASSSSSSITPFNPGSYYSIATTTLGSSTADITFSSIPNTYTHLQIRFIAKSTNSATAADNLAFRFNSDTAGNYTRHYLDGSGSSVTAGANTGVSQVYATCAQTSSAPSAFGVGVLDILDYTNTNKYTTARVLSGQDSNGSGGVDFTSGLWLNTNAISTITLTGGSSAIFQQHSQVALYGIRG